MRSHLDRPGVVCTAAVSLLTAVAVIAPSPARGDDSLPTTQVPSVASITEAVTEATADALPAVPADVTPTADALPGLEPAPASDPAVAAEPVPAPADPALPPAPAAESTPEAPADSAEPASQNDSPADITAPPADIGADTPPAAPVSVPTARTPAPTQAPPTVSANINVSVRIGSAGDNGPVTQINVAAPTAAPLTMSVDEAPAAPQAVQPSHADGGGTAVDRAAGEPTDTWYWNWDCLGVAPIPAISPGVSGTSSFPSSWTWIWNCGDNGQQYQTETPSGYQQINTNIAIRLSSPGNDGGVTQVNLGAGVTIPLPTSTQGGPFVPGPGALPPAAGAILDALPAIAEPALTAVVTGDTTDTSALLAPSSAPVASPSATIPGPLFAAPRALAGALPVGGGWMYGSPALDAPRPAGASDPTATFDPQSAWHAVAPAQTASAPTAEPARPTEAAPRQRPPLPDRVPAVSASGVSAAAAAGGGGGSSGSGLPALLMLPFVAALLDLARRVALEHATWPSGHRRRAPDRPG